MKLLLFTTLALLACLSQTTTAESIPPTHAESLAGQAVQFPDAMRGKVGVLVISFSKKGGSVATDWSKRIDGDFGSDTRVAFYVLPMLADVPRLLRGFIVHGIKSSIPDRDHAHFVPIYQDEAQWRAAVHYADKDDAYILLLDKNVQIVEVMHGAVNEAQYRTLQNRVQSLF